jgi:hypothetical protein
MGLPVKCNKNISLVVHWDYWSCLVVEDVTQDAVVARLHSLVLKVGGGCGLCYRGAGWLVSGHLFETDESSQGRKDCRGRTAPSKPKAGQQWLLLAKDPGAISHTMPE